MHLINPQTPKINSTSTNTILNLFIQVRNKTLDLVRDLNEEDTCLQSMTDASPTKWHLAHSSWFFETFLLKKFKTNYKEFNPDFNFLFNSYYNSIGRNRFPRSKRGLISKPTLQEVINYRKHIDNSIIELMEKGLLESKANTVHEIISILTLGIHHEQQHQELIITDIKHVLSKNPLKPIFSDYTRKIILGSKSTISKKSEYIYQPGGIVEIGYRDGDSTTDFCFDNEIPSHPVYLEPCLISSQLVTNSEFQEFMEDDAYNRPELWLADGFDFIKANNIHCPLYWFKEDSKWQIFTLGGVFKLNPKEPVVHVSFYEAEAFARWRKARLVREVEWESFAEEPFSKRNILTSNFQENNIFHPLATNELQVYGNLWQWTMSPYSPYPGYKELPGTLGEYNGKFMINQMVLKGGSCATPRSHIRSSYRNFFYPQQRWQFMGIRLAQDVS